MNITMYLPSWELGEPTWRVQQLATGPITEVQLGPAPHPFVVFRDLGDFDTMIGVLVGARAAHGEALSRHAARPLVPLADRVHEVWDSTFGCPIEAVAGDESIPCTFRRGHEPPHSWVTEPEREPGDALDALTAAVEANARILRDRAAVAAAADDPGDDEAQDAADRALRRAGVDPADLAELRGEDG